MNSIWSGFLVTTNHMSENREEVIFLKLKSVSNHVVYLKVPNTILHTVVGKTELHSVEKEGKMKSCLNCIKEKHKIKNVDNVNNSIMDLLFL